MRASEYNYKHPVHLKARRAAFERSNGVCQACGQEAASQGHHWEWDYPNPEEMTGDRLTPMCKGCHDLITAERRRKHQEISGSKIGAIRFFTESSVLEGDIFPFVEGYPGLSPEGIVIRPKLLILMAGKMSVEEEGWLTSTTGQSFWYEFQHSIVAKLYKLGELPSGNITRRLRQALRERTVYAAKVCAGFEQYDDGRGSKKIELLLEKLARQYGV